MQYKQEMESSVIRKPRNKIYCLSFIVTANLEVWNWKKTEGLIYYKFALAQMQFLILSLIF